MTDKVANFSLSRVVAKKQGFPEKCVFLNTIPQEFHIHDRAKIASLSLPFHI
jgi:hypothetical protein